MRLTIDQKADALYFRLDDSRIHESEEVRPGVILDFAENGEVVGVEILRLSRRVAKPNLRDFQYQAI